MPKNLEKYIIDIIKGYRQGFYAKIVKAFLHVLSWLFKMVVACRNWAFDQGWLCRHFPPVPLVISIGNIVAGGTGKTPVTLMLAQEFYKQFSIAVVSRGYRSRAEKLSSPVVMSMGGGPLQTALYCGDEPFLLAKHLPGVLVLVGRNRYKASYMAAKAGAQLILLDDGMQHRRLARDFEIVVLDYGDPFGKGYFLPRGFLREGLDSLSRADLIILNHTHELTNLPALEKEINKYTSAPLVATRMEMVEVIEWGGQSVSTIKDKQVGIFCGIAHPEYFYQTVASQGANIVAASSVGDHRPFDSEQLAKFATHCKDKGAELLLCTEKDMVKITNIDKLSLPLASLQMRLKIVSGEEKWSAFIDKARSHLLKT